MTDAPEPYVRVSLSDIYREQLTLGGKVERALDQIAANAKETATCTADIAAHDKEIDELRERKYVTPLGLWTSVCSAIGVLGVVFGVLLKMKEL